MAQRVKDLALSQWQLGLLLWHGFNPLSGNFHMARVWPKRKKKEKKKRSTLHYVTRFLASLKRKSIYLVILSLYFHTVNGIIEHPPLTGATQFLPQRIPLLICANLLARNLSSTSLV